MTPWDAGQSQPPLRDLLASGEIDFPKSGRALVPGCGRVCISIHLVAICVFICVLSRQGYDAILIATVLGLETTGLDISPVAMEAARACVGSHQIPTCLYSLGHAHTRSNTASSNLPAGTKVNFEARDFFALAPTPDERYDLIYDYT